MGEEKKPKFLKRNTLNAVEEKRLEELLARDPATFGEEEKAHLRARIDYLSSDEREMLGDVLDAPKGSKDEDGDAGSMTKNEIMAKLDEAKIKYDPKKKKDELARLLPDESED